MISGKIDEAERILVISHDRPDGDAIGSSVALGQLLSSVGKKVVVVNNDEVPESLQFLPGSEEIQQPKDAETAADLLVVCDAAGVDRIHESVWAAVRQGNGGELPFIVNIDHHVSNTAFGSINYIDSDSPATGEIVCEIAQELGWEITREIADNLYAAISTDTGSFRYPNTTARTYRIVAQLVEAGAEVGRLNQLLYESYPQRRVLALRRLLQDMQIDFDSRCASVTLPLSVTKELGLQLGDTEGIIDTIRAIDSVIVAIFFEELPDGKIRVSSRSKQNEVSVGEICAKFGGGGHTLAAGTRIKGPMETAKQAFLAEVEKALQSAGVI